MPSTPVKARLLKKGFVLKSDYNGRSKKIIIADKNGYLYTPTANTALQYQIDTIVSVHNEFSIRNVRLWLRLNKIPFQLLSGQYKGAKEKLTFRCLVCNETFNRSWDSLYNHDNHGCPYCLSKQIGAFNSLFSLYPDVAKEWYQPKNGDISPCMVAPKSDKYFYWKCPTCCSVYYTSPKHRVLDKSGCPICNSSKGEKRIAEYLRTYNILYEPQAWFSDLVGLNGGKLSYDFRIGKVLIEFQGQFHDGNGSHYVKRNLEKQKVHDELKRKYAEKNGYLLVEIWYHHYDVIEEIMDDIRIKYLS
ncbi:MAG TPA: zinc-ribbon domain-containing protein [Bacteroidales bacterium]|nr:zinc-ribbon domain-containing protein [Bacteroidales bacterium]